MNLFSLIQPWIPHILGAIKKEIKTDHLPKSLSFHKTHFGSKPLSKLTTEEIFKAYETELLAANPEISEWVMSCWVFKHGDIYQHFAGRLSEINPHFDEIKEITEAQAEYILDGTQEKFGPVDVYLFCVLNGVVFPEVVLNRLKSGAEKALATSTPETPASQSIEELTYRYEKEIRKIEEKCEQKIAGVMKKYAIDVESFKKQIRSLQQKLNALSVK